LCAGSWPATILQKMQSSAMGGNLLQRRGVPS
jgi:hypothetical protein